VITLQGKELAGCSSGYDLLSRAAQKSHYLDEKAKAEIRRDKEILPEDRPAESIKRTSMFDLAENPHIEEIFNGSKRSVFKMERGVATRRGARTFVDTSFQDFVDLPVSHILNGKEHASIKWYLADA
jgi:hypothetical protein